MFCCDEHIFYHVTIYTIKTTFFELRKIDCFSSHFLKMCAVENQKWLIWIKFSPNLSFSKKKYLDHSACSFASYLLLFRIVFEHHPFLSCLKLAVAVPTSGAQMGKVLLKNDFFGAQPYTSLNFWSLQEFGPVL